MKNLTHLICPENHNVPFDRSNFAEDFSDGDVDAMSLQPLFEQGLYCSQCDRAYGLSKLKEPENNKRAHSSPEL